MCVSSSMGVEVVGLGAWGKGERSKGNIRGKGDGALKAHVVCTPEVPMSSCSAVDGKRQKRDRGPCSLIVHFWILQPVLVERCKCPKNTSLETGGRVCPMDTMTERYSGQKAQPGQCM